MHRLRSAALFTVASVACGNNAATGDAPGSNTPDAPPADCVMAESYQDLTSIQKHIFTNQCSFSGCHNGEPTPQGMLNLTTVDLAYSSLVGSGSGSGVVALMCPAGSAGGPCKLVVPGHPEESWMMKMLAGITDTTPPSCAIDPKIGIMPMNNNGQPLCPQKIGAIQRWIMAGAPPQ